MREAALSPDDAHFTQLKTTALPLLRKLYDAETSAPCRQSFLAIIDVVETIVELSARRTSDSSAGEKHNESQRFSRWYERAIPTVRFFSLAENFISAETPSKSSFDLKFHSNYNAILFE